MARAPREHRMESRDARLRLAPRKEPYWRQIVPGTFLGYYRGAKGKAGTWITRQRAGDGYQSQRIGTADDFAGADGEVVLDYSQAIKRATTVQVEQRAPLPKHYGDGDTLNALFADYIEDRQSTPNQRTKRTMAPGTVSVSRGFWKRHVEASIGKKLATALSADDIRKWHSALAKKPATVRGKVQDFDTEDASQVRARRSTANRILTLVKATLTWARKRDRLPSGLPDYWRSVDPFGLGDDPPPRMLEADEIRRLLNAAAPDLRALLTGALMTGARYGELCALKVADYSNEHGLVRIHQFKTGKTLWQPLTPEGRGFFDRLTAGREPSQLMFTREDGRPWEKSDARRPMIEATVNANLGDVTFKVTRATYGKALLLATRDLELVAKALGHSDSRITRKHYAQLLPREVAAGVALMPALGLTTDNKVSRIAGRKRRTG